MRITPLDIQQKQFATKFRGFDMEEVDSFLELLREEMEELLRDNANLREEARRFEKQLKEYKNIETTLRDTMVKTQQMVEEYQGTAKKDADLMLKEAALQADQVMHDAQGEKIKLQEDITDLKILKRHMKEEIRRLLERYARELDFDTRRDDEVPDERNERGAVRGDLGGTQRLLHQRFSRDVAWARTTAKTTIAAGRTNMINVKELMDVLVLRVFGLPSLDDGPNAARLDLAARAGILRAGQDSRKAHRNTSKP